MISISKTPKNSFYSFDDLQIYTNKNNVRFVALRGHPVKRVDSSPMEINVKESTKKKFIEALKNADTSSGLSHLLQESLLKELQNETS